MLNLDLKTILKVCGGKLVLPDNNNDELLDKCPDGIVHDTGDVKENYIFIAIRGGNNYIHKAFENGALASICDKQPESITGPCIVVNDSIQAMIKLATYYRKTLSVKIVGIIGSVGKTSTRQFVASVLAQKYRITETTGNHNNNIGLALEIFKITPDIEMSVLEMGISEFGEMTVLSDIAKPDVCVFTNIAECHLEKLRDRDGVLEAKTECFANMNPNGYVVLNGEDDKLNTIKEVNGHSPYRFGVVGQDVYATNIDMKGTDGSDVLVHSTICGEEAFKAHVSVPGVHMIKNALAATAVGKLYGVSNDQIAKGIELAGTIEGRSNVITTDKYIILDDCYNASPVSMRSSIDNLKNVSKGGRMVAILGDMFELGEQAAELHRLVGEYAADNAIEVILTVGELAKNMHIGAMSANICEMQEISHFNDKEELFNRLPSILMDGDTILVKASHGMRFDEVVEKLKKM